MRLSAVLALLVLGCGDPEWGETREHHLQSPDHSIWFNGPALIQSITCMEDGWFPIGVEVDATATLTMRVDAVGGGLSMSLLADGERLMGPVFIPARQGIDCTVTYATEAESGK